MQFSGPGRGTSLPISVAIARGIHLFPFRTEPLSLSAPMVLGPRGPGRVGRRRSLSSRRCSVGSPARCRARVVDPARAVHGAHAALLPRRHRSRPAAAPRSQRPPVGMRWLQRSRPPLAIAEQREVERALHEPPQRADAWIRSDRGEEHAFAKLGGGADGTAARPGSKRLPEHFSPANAGYVGALGLQWILQPLDLLSPAQAHFRPRVPGPEGARRRAPP